MANSEFAFIQLFWELINRKTGDLGRVDYRPQKPAFDLYAKEEQPLPRATPESQGLSSAYIADFVREMGTTPGVDIHAITIVRHGHIVFEGSYDPYRTDVWHVTYSMCKSFTGMAIGLLVDEGKLMLDTRVCDVLQPNATPVGSFITWLKYADLKIRDLLVMASGASFNETGAISGNDWVRGYFDSNPKFAPGEKFEYNSMNSVILSAVVTKLTGETMFEYLKRKLFVPMGITRVFWETSPMGITKAGWGLFITQEDAAKLGLLYLNHGMWNGQQLISREWVEDATRPHIQTGRETNPEYGYHVWIGDAPGSFMYNGMLGQNVYVYPGTDLMVITNAGNSEVFSGGTMTKIVHRYWGKDFTPPTEALPEDVTALHALERVKARMEGRSRIMHPIQRGGWGRSGYRGNDRDHFLKQLDGNIYEMHSKGIGLFPLIMQVVHNNYTNGISRMRFDYSKGDLKLVIREGNDVHVLPVGFDRGRHSVVRTKGEEYIVGTLGRLAEDEDGVMVLTLRICFIEEATERSLKIKFRSEHDIALYWNEVPGNTIITDTLEMITTGSGNTNPVFSGLLNSVNPGLIKDAMHSAIGPVVNASLVAQSRFHNRKS